jgi:CheY-like chemotaxis protein
MEDWLWHERTEPSDLPRTLVKPCFMICDETGDLAPVFARHADNVEIVKVDDLAQAAERAQCSPAQALLINTTLPQALYELVQQARRELPGLPVLGCCLAAKTEHALAAGAIGYLLKPITRDQLEAALQAVSGPLRRVLVVDDDPDALRLFVRMLRVCDDTLDIITASTGAQALEQLRLEQPDLMLLDVILPDIDGWQVLAAKNQDESLRRVAVLMLTAQDPDQRPAASEALILATSEGLSLSQLLRCSQALPQLLRYSERAPDAERLSA